MQDNSIYEFFKKLNEDKIVFAYSGEFSNGLLEAIYALMEKQADEEIVPLQKRKKFFHVLIESLQNVLHHSANGSMAGRSGLILKKDGDNNLIITTGNPIETDRIGLLKQKLDEVNSFPAEELTSKYREKLSRTELSEKGGAGLGIIELARKSGNKLQYEFFPINEKYSFFCLTITIK
jgi:hypothetical protein